MSTPHRDEWSGRRVDDADFSYARLHSPNFEGVKITDGWLANALDAEAIGLDGTANPGFDEILEAR
jgi:hypothetical protein